MKSGEKMYALNREQNGFAVTDTPMPPKPPQTTLEEGAVTPKERGELLKAIEYMRGLEDGWDGFGASAPGHASLQTAEHFIKQLPFGLAYPDKISPDMEETLSLTWILKASDELHMTIDGLYIYLSKLGTDDTIEDLAELKFLAGGFFPEDIRRHLPSYPVKKHGKTKNPR